MLGAVGAGFAGLVAGTLHALLGPDHLAAVGPVSVARRGKAVWAGLNWGLGHAIGTWLLAAVALAGWQLLDINLFSAWAEKLVGVVLIGMGLWGFYSLLRQRIHAHPHEHDGERHAHIHAHRRAADGSHNGAAHRRHSHAVAGIGLLHGVAGVGPFLAVMPAMVLAEPMVRNVYVMAYGLGAMFAMGLFAWVVGVVVCRAGGRSARVYNGMVAGSAGVALSVGTLWLLQ